MVVKKARRRAQRKVKQTEDHAEEREPKEEATQAPPRSRRGPPKALVRKEVDAREAPVEAVGVPRVRIEARRRSEELELI
mmetsp:Transcript_122248/g.191757  ORF Transcript_122248/g.191757 Transcript_122248/m.191757 type:complete len:80 (+) Transcript_122248:366-605(+)